MHPPNPGGCFLLIFFWGNVVKKPIPLKNEPISYENDPIVGKNKPIMINFEPIINTQQ
jgi:hypothetical protein